MTHTLDIIERQIASKRAFNQNRNQMVLDKGQFQKFHWELYPLLEDYYHELNPFFVANLYKKELFDFTEVITVRDGKIAFANFLVSNVDAISKTKTHFIIPQSFADIIPASFKDRFSCWQLSQTKKLPISKAKRVIIFGMLIDKYIGPIEELKSRLENDFKNIDPDATIELLLSQRSDPFVSHHKESLIHFEVFDVIRSLFPGRKITFAKLNRYLEGFFGEDDYFYDLKYDDMIVSDSYLDYFFANKGSTVHQMPDTRPADLLRSLKISFHHEIHISPFNFVSNEKFSEMIFYKRLNNKNLIQDKHFQRIITSG
jgi:hypothetical protein